MTLKLGDLIEPDLSENAHLVLAKRYLKKDQHGNSTESATELFARVATNIAQAEKILGGTPGDVEKWAGVFYSLMAKREFMPNSPTLMNAGRDLQQLSACFVLPVEDSMQGIFETLKNAALIHKSGGGTGFSFSRLRPKDDRVKTTGGVASGPVSFLEVYDAATEHVKQGGTRRGANMGILRIDHPDILEFISSKQVSDDAITNFNISVAITEDFMSKVIAGDEYNLINPHDGGISGKLNAKEVFETLVNSAWRNGDPGIVFMDRMNDSRTNPTPQVGQIEATNPCGEQPLLPYESCNLGSINLERFYDEAEVIDWDRLAEAVGWGVRFLDNVIEMNNYPLPQIAKITREGNRKIGLGVMGWADLLFRANVAYDSDQALELGETLMKFVQEQADQASEDLAHERGVFPNWYGSWYEEQDRKMRNATRTTIAPTGTISIIAGCSSGIEPLFALAFKRHQADEEMFEVNRQFVSIGRENGWYTDELAERIIEHGGTRGVEAVPKEVADVFVTAHEVSPQWHLKHQAAFQKYTDNAVSKTVNMPNTSGTADVHEVYMLAYELGCKGVTIYRDGSKQTQVLSVGSSKVAEVAIDKCEDVNPRKVPDTEHGLTARRFQQPTPLGKMHVFVSELDNKPFEVFVVFGKAGSDTTAFAEAIGRLTSLSLRCNIPIELVIKQLEGIGGRSSHGFGPNRVLSVPDALAKLLRRHYIDGLSVDEIEADTVDDTIDVLFEQRPNLEICPDCQEYAYEFAEGCGKCHACGFSNC
jgi:ribonucleoside-diphosphate reductase alpha chain